jgi:uncharacterized protein YcbK (DUF882 family)
MQLTRNFNIKEFACKDGTPVPQSLALNAIELAVNLQVIRDMTGCELTITSAYRTPSHNKKIGGASRSMHLECKAADLKSKCMTPAQLHKVIETLIREGRIHDGGLKKYNTFVHYDIGRKRRW